MSNAELATLIGAFILTHGAALMVFFWKAGNWLVNKLLKYQEFKILTERDISDLKTRADKNEKDINAAHGRFREISNTKKQPRQ